MDIIISITLACIVIGLAGFAICQAGYNIWRFGLVHTRRVAVVGSTAQIVAKLALIIIEIIRILFLTAGTTPADTLIRLGFDVPVSANRWILLYGIEIQVIIGTLAFIWMNHAVKSCYFPPGPDPDSSTPGGPHD